MPSAAAQPATTRIARRGAHQQLTSLPTTTSARDWVAIATWGLLLLGVAMRVFRFSLRFPLWGDECLLATNFIDRGFGGLMSPLDNHQVAPVVFLWMEEAATRLFGFNELSLRLVPLLAGVLAVVLLFRFARRELPPLSALFAVGFFAVSSYAARHSVEVKPYALDALMTAVLLTAAWPLWQRDADVRRLWLVAPLAGLAILVSYPAVFFAGAVGVVSLMHVVRTRSKSAWLGLGVYGIAVTAAFGVVLLSSAGPQFAAERAVMRTYWGDAFPPLSQPWRLPLWLLDAHTGEMFAYPLGGETGGSTLTFILFAIGAVSLWRSNARPLVIATLVTLGLALVAAALQRYPYGGHPRLMQYAAPLICLLAGAGLGQLLSSDERPALARNIRVAIVTLLATIGLGLMAHYAIRPYQDIRDVERRQAIVDLWRDLAANPGTRLSVEADFGVDLAPGSAPTIGRIMYRCYETIYSTRTPGTPEQLVARVTPAAPLYCVAQRIREDALDSERHTAWLDFMATQYQLQLREQRTVDVAKPDPEAYEIFEFVPRRVARAVLQ